MQPIAGDEEGQNWTRLCVMQPIAGDEEGETCEIIG